MYIWCCWEHHTWICFQCSEWIYIPRGQWGSRGCFCMWSWWGLFRWTWTVWGLVRSWRNQRWGLLRSGHLWCCHLGGSCWCGGRGWVIWDNDPVCFAALAGRGGGCCLGCNALAGRGFHTWRMSMLYVARVVACAWKHQRALVVILSCLLLGRLWD